MKEDEERLLAAIIKDQEPDVNKRKTVDDIADELKMEHKRAYYLVDRWSFWEYGVSLRTGWIDNFGDAKHWLKDVNADRKKI